MKQKYFRLVSILLIFFLNGCASIECRTKKYPLVAPGVYPGVRKDLDDITPNEDFFKTGTLFRIAPIIDLPLSFVLDTICLPFDIYQNNKDIKAEVPETKGHEPILIKYASPPLSKWLNRRSQRKSCNWQGFGEMLAHYKIPNPRIIGYW